MEEFSQLICQRHPRLWGSFGYIDGLKLPVQESSDPEVENVTYNGWLHDHFISCVLVFGLDGIFLFIIFSVYQCLNQKIGTVLACWLNAPGSWHDSKVAQPIYEKLQEKTPAGYYLVADTAFLHGTGDVANHI